MAPAAAPRPPKRPAGRRRRAGAALAALALSLAARSAAAQAPAVPAAEGRVPLPPMPAALSPGVETYLDDKRFFLGVLGSWALLSAGTGALLWAKGDAFERNVGIQFVAWGGIDGLLAGVGLWRLRDERRELAGGAPLAEKRGKFRQALLVNALADAAYISGGAILYGLGKNDALRGLGAGVVAQGTFLLAFDNLGLLYFLPPRLGGERPRLR